MDLTPSVFEHEIAEALKNYDKYVLCIDKTPDQCRDSIDSLMEKAIKAYITRGANLRHGIALDHDVTIILSQTEGDKPLCGIYFNLYSPYRKSLEKK